MAASNESPPASVSSGDDELTELQKRDNWFTASPDPWAEIARLEFGGDRSFATTVQRMIAHAEPAQRGALEVRLIEELARPELSDAGRQFICRMLGRVGSGACVPAVARLLENNRTADDARLALDFIDDASVDPVYRAALLTLTGAAKLGVIGSIGRRGDAGAIEALTAVALDEREDARVRGTAERVVERLSKEANRR